MAIPFLLTLTRSARLVYPHIIGGVRRGLSANAIERSIRNAGLRITRISTLNPLIARIKAIERHGASLRFANKRFTIRTQLLPESLTDIRQKYSYTYRVSGTNELGDIVSRFVTVTTDNAALTVAELDESARSLVVVGSISDSLSDVEVVMDFGVRRSDTF